MSSDFKNRLANFSSDFPVKVTQSTEDWAFTNQVRCIRQVANQYARMDVTRGFSSRQIEDYSKWSSQYQGSNFSYSAKSSGFIFLYFLPVFNFFYFSSIHAFPYPLADTFPQSKELGVENSQGTSEPVQPESSALRAVQSYSSLSASANTAKVLEKYASFIEDCVRRRGSAITSIDISSDDLTELVNDLWTMHDNSSAETDELSLL